jgi:hypothetical protein
VSAELTRLNVDPSNTQRVSQILRNTFHIQDLDLFMAVTFSQNVTSFP